MLNSHPTYRYGISRVIIGKNFIVRDTPTIYGNMTLSYSIDMVLFLFKIYIKNGYINGVHR